MHNRLTFIALAASLTLLAGSARAQAPYVPSEGNLQSRKEFSQHRLGIFLHWGIYSTYAQGEWYLSTGHLDPETYSETAAGFYPARFDAAEWARAFKEAGAGYVTLTSRHHDGFSMFKTAQTPFNIVDATPFGRDVLGELTKAVKDQGMRMHYYYSLIDWIRPDYPKGNSGVAKDPAKADYDAYFEFEKRQIRELLEQYHPQALWFDGQWDQGGRPFDWRMRELYDFIHGIDPDCMIGNNHHSAALGGEDFQLFEKDLPGENKAGFSGGATVSESLPLEACETMNNNWGYHVADLNYKSVRTLVHLLVRGASKGSNLLLNIGPQANGALPEPALERLRGLGEWMRAYASTVDGCGVSPVPPQSWGVSTRRPGTVFLHVLEPASVPISGDKGVLVIPFQGKPSAVKTFPTGASLKWKADKEGFLTISIPAPDASAIDTVIEIDGASL